MARAATSPSQSGARVPAPSIYGRRRWPKFLGVAVGCWIIAACAASDSELTATKQVTPNTQQYTYPQYNEPALRAHLQKLYQVDLDRLRNEKVTVWGGGQIGYGIEVEVYWSTFNQQRLDFLKLNDNQKPDKPDCPQAITQDPCVEMSDNMAVNFVCLFRKNSYKSAIWNRLTITQRLRLITAEKQANNFVWDKYRDWRPIRHLGGAPKYISQFLEKRGSPFVIEREPLKGFEIKLSSYLNTLEDAKDLREYMSAIFTGKISFQNHITFSFPRNPSDDLTNRIVGLWASLSEFASLAVACIDESTASQAIVRRRSGREDSARLLGSFFGSSSLPAEIDNVTSARNFLRNQGVDRPDDAIMRLKNLAVGFRFQPSSKSYLAIGEDEKSYTRIGLEVRSLKFSHMFNLVDWVNAIVVSFLKNLSISTSPNTTPFQFSVNSIQPPYEASSIGDSTRLNSNALSSSKNAYAVDTGTDSFAFNLLINAPLMTLEQRLSRFEMNKSILLDARRKYMESLNEFRHSNGIDNITVPVQRMAEIFVQWCRESRVLELL